jgi:hypothetical protein
MKEAPPWPSELRESVLESTITEIIEGNFPIEFPPPSPTVIVVPAHVPEATSL